MRKITRNARPETSNANSKMENKAMKRTSRDSNSNSNAKKDALAALEALGINISALFSQPEKQPEKQPKADRAYEMPSLGADFTKTAIYAAPKSDNAITYLNSAKELCDDVLNNLVSPIADDVRSIAERADKNAGDALKDDLLALASAWQIPPQSMRVIMQLCAPVVACCNSETDEIARRAYGMARANSLMGSACNTLMYSKAADKNAALPFKRVAHNLTALGLDFNECTSVEDCDFCEDDKDFEKVVTLCDMWLNKCERIAPKEPAPQKARGGKKASASEASASEDKNAQILALLQSLLNK